MVFLDVSVNMCVCDLYIVIIYIIYVYKNNYICKRNISIYNFFLKERW